MADRSVEIAEGEGISFASYATGFLLSILLTVAAYLVVVGFPQSPQAVIITIACLGIVQAVVQLHFFLHLGKSSRPRWNILVFAFMVILLIVIVLGSLWIMFALNDRVMPTAREMEEYMLRESGMYQPSQ
jgi:cytochrome o ubiquinol oxidase subunit IV